MPLNVRRFFASTSLIFSAFLIAGAQTVPTTDASNTPNNTAAPVNPAAPAPTSGDVMRARVSKAKAFIAVRNYNAAIYELENIRRETNDSAVNSVVNVLLMNSYLEQGDYKRAQDFLGDFYKAQTANKPNASAQYLTVAAQIVKGARNQYERYHALGLSVSDRNLPLEASVDIQKMRDTLELVIEQSKNIGKDKKQTSGAMALLEEATNTRGTLAKDDYDAKRWKDEVGDAREMLANSRSVIVNAAGDAPAETNNTAGSMSSVAANINPPTVNPPVVSQPKIETPRTNDSNNLFKPVVIEKPNTANNTTAQNDNPKPETPKPNTDNQTAAPNNSQRTRKTGDVPANNTANDDNQTPGETVKDNSPLSVGSLVGYATKKTNPTYPVVAKSLRTTGIVTVEVLVDEAGEVSEIQKTNGPSILQPAAKDAVKRWKFKPFVRDGQPVKATGYVSFNFNL